MPPLYIAIVGPGEAASQEAIVHAEEVARLVARRGWITLCGGRDAGVMAAAACGASDAGGIVIGILPDADRTRAAPHRRLRSLFRRANLSFWWNLLRSPKNSLANSQETRTLHTCAHPQIRSTGSRIPFDPSEAHFFRARVEHLLDLRYSVVWVAAERTESSNSSQGARALPSS